MNRLNFGCGSIQPAYWLNIDSDPQYNTALDTKWVEEPYFDLIVAHCVLQTIDYNELVNVLKELYRILKPGGVLRISLPDILAGFEAYKAEDITWFPNGEEKIDDRFSAWLTWYSTTKTLLTEHALINKLSEAGFLHFVPSNYGESLHPNGAELDTRQDECYFMEVTK